MTITQAAPVSPFGWSTARPDGATPRKPLPNRPERVVSCTGTTGRWPAGRGTGPRTAPTRQAPPQLTRGTQQAQPRTRTPAGPGTPDRTGRDRPTKFSAAGDVSHRPRLEAPSTRERDSVPTCIFARPGGVANPTTPIRRRRVAAIGGTAGAK